MSSDTILLPFFGVMLLTLVVWTTMYIRRTSFLLREQIDLRKVDTPEKAAAVIPGKISLPSHNLKNLFELPALFYALCLYLYVAGLVDQIYLAAAWLFFVLRVLHSIVHCTKNIVMLRFYLYSAAALVLWFMLGRALFRELGALLAN